MRRGRAFFAAAIVVVLATGALAAPFSITCTDGAGADIRFGARRKRLAEMCDTDHRCDGVCTFSFRRKCLPCLFRRAKDCHLPSVVDASCSWDDFGCAPEPHFELLTHALVAEPGRVVRRTVRAGRNRVTLRCRASTACTPVASTTTTLPPGVPDLHGDWIVTSSNDETDCPPSVAASSPPSRMLRIFQDGTAVSMCATYGLATPGNIVTAPAFALDLPGSGVVAPEGTYVGESRMQGAVVTPDGSITGRHETRYRRFGPLAVTTCSARGPVRLEKRRLPCATPADCLTGDPCTRCVGGTCQPVPDCYLDWNASF